MHILRCMTSAHTSSIPDSPEKSIRQGQASDGGQQHIQVVVKILHRKPLGQKLPICQLKDWHFDANVFTHYLTQHNRHTCITQSFMFAIIIYYEVTYPKYRKYLPYDTYYKTKIFITNLVITNLTIQTTADTGTHLLYVICNMAFNYFSQCINPMIEYILVLKCYMYFISQKIAGTVHNTLSDFSPFLCPYWGKCCKEIDRLLKMNWTTCLQAVWPWGDWILIACLLTPLKIKFSTNVWNFDFTNS